MKIRMIFFALLLAFAAQSKAQNSVYDFEVKDADGKMVSLNAYKGKVLLIVNTATKCGFTFPVINSVHRHPVQSKRYISFAPIITA